MSWPEHHIAPLAIFQLEEHFSQRLAAARSTTQRFFIPQVFRLQHRHAYLLAARAIHLFANDL